MTHLIIAGASIKTDSEGRFSLNDLHKAAGGEKRHSPNYWLNNQQTQEFIEVLGSAVIPVVTLEGRKGGTFACRELIYAYAMWLSPAFHLHVIRAFDALVNGQISEAQRIASRQNARLDFKPMTDALVLAREELGKATAAHHHMNEANLINRIAIGMTATQFKAEHGLPASAHLRDFLTELQMKCVEHLQRANTTMIEMGYTYDQRKIELKKIYDSRHAAGLLAEVQRLES